MQTISQPKLIDLLVNARNIAVVGASPNPDRPSHWISEYLTAQGYTVIPVNPGHEELFGLKCYHDLDSIKEDIDIVNIYRRSDTVVPIVENALKRTNLQLIWMQDNVFNRDAYNLAEEAGLPMVMDDCIYRIHRQL